MSTNRPLLSQHKRIVVKIGSSVLASRERGLHEARIGRIADEVAALRQAGHDVVIVSSGAVLCGSEKMGFTAAPATLVLKQAAAAVGQSRLMWAYEKSFSALGVTCAQVLLTREDIASRRRFINARNTLTTLLAHQVLPIVNENDTVAVAEIKLGDNDHLAALVAHLVDATLLILLSDVDGLYSSDPRGDPQATCISQVTKITPAIEAMAGGTGKRGGTGGMSSKVAAAKSAAAYGIATLILNGGAPEQIGLALAGQSVGTLFLQDATRRSEKKQWIAQIPTRGEVVIDAGAAAAITHGGKSLLPSGVCEVRGRFQTGDAIRCLSEDGVELARGLTNYGADEMIRIAGARSSVIAEILGDKPADEVIHRDNMVRSNVDSN